MRNYSCLFVVTCLLFVPAPMLAQTPNDEAPANAQPEEKQLRFAFDGTPWRDVIEWLAAESGLALHVSGLPTGSLTYTDPGDFTEQEAIDRVNLFLLPQGYSLVRSGRLLSVINLSDPRSVQQLSTLAKLVRPEELEGYNRHDVVRCFFPLGEITAEDAVQELAPLNLMTEPSVFARTNQLLITDTAGKLRNVKTVLDGFKPSGLANGTVVRNFALKHVDAEDILTVVRPHLGLATGEMIGIDVSISSDLQNKNIFVTGVEDKVKLIENLVESLDKPKESLSVEDGTMQLRSHQVAGGNVETVYNVLQTLLARKTVRMSMDETSGAIVALASPDVQREIEQTVQALQAAEADFEVIPLKIVDPYLAVSLLEEMLDLPGPFDDPEDIDPDAPKIDADPANMRLFVRGKRHQIDQIKKIVQGLDVKNGGTTSDTGIRLFPLRGKQAVVVLETAAKFWRSDNPVLLIGETNVEPANTERVINDPVSTPTTIRQDNQSVRLLSMKRNSQGSPIQCQLTPRGVLLQCDDSEALDQFEEHLRTIAGPLGSVPSPPVVFYLKYTRPDDALRMLSELLDGGDSALESESSSLVNGYVESGGSLLGSLVTNRDGMTTLISGSITVVADTRLNRLIAQGSAADIERIESYLKIVDKESSITDVQTYGRSHIIELKHTRASEVAATLREAYAGRLSTGPAAASASQSKQQQPQQAAANKQPQQPEAKRGNEDDGGGKKAPQPAKRPSGRASAARNLEPKMTIAVHEPSNSLIVTAPDSLFQEVEQLVKLIDTRGRRAVEVIGPVHSAAMESLLQEVFGGGTSSRRRSSPSPSRAPSSPAPSSSPNFSPTRGKPLR